MRRRKFQDVIDEAWMATGLSCQKRTSGGYLFDQARKVVMVRTTGRNWVGFFQTANGCETSYVGVKADVASWCVTWAARVKAPTEVPAQRRLPG